MGVQNPDRLILYRKRKICQWYQSMSDHLMAIQPIGHHGVIQTIDIVLLDRW
jgi:hypothetical protein